MSVFDIINLLGGLAIFLYGMTLMGESLKRMAGGKLQSLLEKLSSTPAKGILLGTVVTAIIQSSSATTVMVVGFVNSGIMQLHQGIGIIMGANIGTTATSWILSLTGVSGDNFFLKLLQPSSFSPIICLIGTVLFVFVKNSKKKQIGSILLGFGILMYGMTAMSSSADALAGSETFMSFITVFDEYPILGIFIGIIITAILQSSSASVGILQALAVTGTISYSVAIPLVLGMSIGACAPVLLSAAGANKNGKRAALIYLYFNLIGSVIFMIVYYAANAFSGGFSFAPLPATAVGIAVVNTVFKLFSTVILFPFTKQLEKLTVISVPDKKGEKEDLSELLDVRFLSSPSFAIQKCREVINEMAELDVYSVNTALDMFKNYDGNMYDAVALNEETTDEYEDKLGTYLLRLSEKNLSDVESREASKLLHSLSDLERISDYAKNLAIVSKEIYEKKITFTDECNEKIRLLSEAVREITNCTVKGFCTNDTEMLSRVEPLDDIIEDLCEIIKSGYVETMLGGAYKMETGFIINDILTGCERVAGHCSNVAVCAIRMGEEKYDSHTYLRSIKTDDVKYKEYYNEMKEKYLI